MGGAKPWQIALIVIGLLVGAVSIGYATFGGNRVHQAKRILMADVSTGQLFWVSTKKRTAALPVRHPDTGKNSLLPVIESGDGYRLDPRVIPELPSLGVPLDGVDKSTGAVKATPGDPRSTDA